MLVLKARFDQQLNHAMLFWFVYFSCSMWFKMLIRKCNTYDETILLCFRYIRIQKKKYAKTMEASDVCHITHCVHQSVPQRILSLEEEHSWHSIPQWYTRYSQERKLELSKHLIRPIVVWSYGLHRHWCIPRRFRFWFQVFWKHEVRQWIDFQRIRPRLHCQSQCSDCNSAEDKSMIFFCFLTLHSY